MIEILPKVTNFAFIYADQENQELELIKLKTVTGRDPEILRRGIKSFGKLGKFRIVLGLDSDLATTVYSSISLVRDNPRDPVDEADLDNLISQAVWKFFDRQRARVADKMGVNDFDVLLADVRVGQIRLDGHRVVNPLGFRARAVEVQLSQTFTTRPVVNQLKQFLPMSAISFVSEAGIAWAHLVAHAKTDNNFLSVHLFDDRTAIFLRENFYLAHFDNLSWGEKDLLGSLSKALMVSDGVAKAILGRYLQDDVSIAFRRRLEGFLNAELAAWAQSVGVALSKAGARTAYLYSFFDLPKTIFSPAFRNKFGSSVKLYPINEDFISEHYHFKLKYKKEEDRKKGFTTLVAALEAIAAPRYEKASHLAKKRVRWLSPI